MGSCSILVQTNLTLSNLKIYYQILRNYWKKLFFGDKSEKIPNTESTFIVQGFLQELQVMKEVYLAAQEYFV